MRIDRGGYGQAYGYRRSLWRGVLRFHRGCGEGPAGQAARIRAMTSSTSSLSRVLSSVSLALSMSMSAAASPVSAVA